jgi:NTE family protein
MVTKLVNVALQGGGAHGAYAWGVLDHFLEDERLELDSLTGTSAGAMNAVVCAYGLMKGGRQAARDALHNFWYEVSAIGNGFKLVYHTPWQQYMNLWNTDLSFSSFMTQAMTRFFSPYEFNPYNYNPLKEVLTKVVDFDELPHCKCINVFIGATNVRTGKIKVFHNKAITLETVLASCSLPFLYQAVKVNGDYYWDGGYTGNPPLFPLISRSKSSDVIIIHINPINRHDIPLTAHDIMNRVHEINLNNSLLKELRAIAFVIKLLEEGWLKKEYEKKLRKLFIHSIHAQPLKDLGVSSKFSSDWKFLTYLRDLGKAAAKEWLDENFESLGEQSTVDFRKEFIDVSSTKMS